MGIALMLSVIVLSGCLGSDDEPGQTPQPAELLGHTFVSSSVTEDGEPRPLVPDTEISLSFREEDGREIIGWDAGCNRFGGDVEITADQLIVRRIAGTEMGCAADLLAQDTWLVDFFDADPDWELTDDELTLSSEETVVVFAPPPPES